MPPYPPNHQQPKSYRSKHTKKLPIKHALTSSPPPTASSYPEQNKHTRHIHELFDKFLSCFRKYHKRGRDWLKWWKKIFSLNILVLFVQSRLKSSLFNSRWKYWPINYALSLKFVIEVAREGVGDIDWRGRVTFNL